MTGKYRNLLIGTSILGSIGCTPGEMNELDETRMAAEELGIDSHSERVIVRFHSQAPLKLALEGEDMLVRELHGELNLATIPVPADMDAADLVTMLRERSDIRFAELDRVRSITLFDQKDNGFLGQWNMRKIGARAAWQKDYNGASTIVAVVDTGVSDRGQDGLDLTSGWTAGWDFVGNDADPSDANGHGTHVAGTIAQHTGNGLGVTGVAHGSQIMAIRVLDANGSGYVSDVASGILWAADHGADVINLSLGSSVGSEAEQEAIAYAADMGVLVVAASGNEYLMDGVSYPAAYPEVLAVGASNGIDEVVAYSNRGPELDLVAPGGDMSRDDDDNGIVDGIIQETVINGEWDHYLFQGTSMASPHVAGAAAVLMGMGASADEARDVLEQTARDISSDGVDPDSGWGRLDLKAAVAELEARLDEPVHEEPVDEEPVDEDPDHSEPGEPMDDDGLVDPQPDLDDMVAPEFTGLRAQRCDLGAHVRVQTTEVAGVMLCERQTSNCVTSEYGESHHLELHTNAAKLDLLARDPSGNTRVIPLDL